MKKDSNDYSKDFGAFIQEKRLWRNITQEEAATALGITQAFYSMIECGKRKIDFELAIRICKYLELDIADFMKKYI